MRAFAIAAALGVLALLPLSVQVRGKVPTEATVASIEQGIRDCANRNRRARGIAPLAAAAPLGKAARLHARNMARQGFFDHTDPQGRGPAERVAIFDGAGRFAFVGENIGAGYRSVASACQAWMGSAGHRRNILEPGYTHIGGGFARGGRYGRYYVQVFAALSAQR